MCSICKGEGVVRYYIKHMGYRNQYFACCPCGLGNGYANILPPLHKVQMGEWEGNEDLSEEDAKQEVMNLKIKN